MQEINAQMNSMTIIERLWGKN